MKCHSKTVPKALQLLIRQLQYVHFNQIFKKRKNKPLKTVGTEELLQMVESVYGAGVCTCSSECLKAEGGG